MILVLLICALCHAGASVISYPVRPPMYPLAVRSPYLSTWIKGSHDGIMGVTPEFWNGQALGWTGLIRVDHVVYSLFGGVPDDIECKQMEQISQSYTADSSTFQFEGAALKVELVFSNPITATDYKRQSIPFSYLEVKLNSSASQTQNIDLYFEINGAWLSGEVSNLVSWRTEKRPASVNADERLASETKGHDIFSHKIRRTTQLLFTEIRDMAEWGELHWSTDYSNNLTTSTGLSAANSRMDFVKQGYLSNAVDTDFRAINISEPVFAFAKSFRAADGPHTALFSIGLVQDQALQVNLPTRGYETAYPLYQRYFRDVGDMIVWHYADYNHSSHHTFSLATNRDSTKIHLDYPSISELSAVQAMGATQLVINLDNPDGEPHLWMKEISSSGNMQTSDVMYPSLPFFLYANPKLAVAMLEPLLIHQEASLYPKKYAMHDMGARYPNATGHPDGNDEYMPVEECGNNLIMMLATHDALVATAADLADLTYAKNWISSHYNIALQWTQYLLEYGLLPESQLSTDDFAGALANQTNLAVKAIVGIKCMSIIAHLSNQTSQSQNLSSVAANFVDQWISLAYEPGIPFAKLSYGWKGSWGSLYNLFPDKLLDLKLFPDSVYKTQNAWYSKVMEPYGLPLDSRHLYTKSDWLLFIASLSEDGVQDQILQRASRWINETGSRKPLIDLYDSREGGSAVNVFTNRPVVGGHFALLAQQLMDKNRQAVSSTRESANTRAATKGFLVNGQTRNPSPKWWL